MIFAVAQAMSSRQQLAVPRNVLDADNLLRDADILESEHVLVRAGRQLAFFHEVFFDYAFARRWAGLGRSLVEFLLEGDQELFRRGQVRQILHRLHEDDPGRFLDETQQLLVHGGIRFHLKAVGLAVLRALPAPTVDECRLVRSLAGVPDLELRLWMALRTRPWFDRLNAEGVLSELLASGEPRENNYALEVLRGILAESPHDVAEVIAPFADRHPHYDAWLRWLTRAAKVHESRTYFDLLLAAVRCGAYDGREADLWLSVHGLGEHQPLWAIELLTWLLTGRAGALTLSPEARVPQLHQSDSSLIELVRQAAACAPREYCAAIIPFMLKVMRLTEHERDTRPVQDAYFSYRYPHSLGAAHDLATALFDGCAQALKALAAHEVHAVKPLLELLAADEHEGAQNLLYTGLSAAGAALAERSAAILLEGEHRFFSGTQLDAVWTARELLVAISTHLSPECHAQIESALLGIRAPWDTRGRGAREFRLLSALDEPRLSPKAQRRLGELRRAFKTQQPAVSPGIVARPAPRSIPPSALPHMTDAHWLRALEKYSSKPATAFAAGAHDLAGVLQDATANDPGRFAALALRFTADTHPGYTTAVLQGLTQAASVESDALWRAVRHLASLAIPDNDLQVAHLLRRHSAEPVPDYIIALLLRIAVSSPTPRALNRADEPGHARARHDADLYESGINTGRGRAADTLANLLFQDPDGQRTALVSGTLQQLAQDPSIAVRACAARVVSAVLPQAPEIAMSAFEALVSADDHLLAELTVARLTISIARLKMPLALPVIERMLACDVEQTRRRGGQLAVYAGLELGQNTLLGRMTASSDPVTRAGAAAECAAILAHTADPQAASALLRAYLDDAHAEVREQAAQFVASLRGGVLRPFAALLRALIDSPAFDEATATSDHP